MSAGLAYFLANQYGAGCIVDIGGRAPAGFARNKSPKLVSIALSPASGDQNNEGVSVRNAGSDPAPFVPVEIDPAVLQSSVVICTGELERAAEPAALLEWLAFLSRRALAVIVTVTESRMTISDFKQLLDVCGLQPSFLGLTVNSSINLDKKTALAIFDRVPLEDRPPDAFRPLAIVGTFNESDVAPQTIAKLLADAIDVAVLDNWSTDGTYEALQALAKAHKGLTIERFPAEGPSRYFNGAGICKDGRRLPPDFRAAGY